MFTLPQNQPRTLRQPAEPVTFGESMQPVVGAMFHIMMEQRGIGLAANQVGLPHRIIVVNVNGLRQEFINPVIVKRYGGKHTAREGCLSFPGRYVPVVRDKQIIVEGFDQDWTPIRRKLKGLAARCVQHEVDHLDGVCIL